MSGAGAEQEGIAELQRLVDAGAPEADARLARYVALHPLDPRGTYLRGLALWRFGRLSYAALRHQLEECAAGGDPVADLLTLAVDVEAGNTEQAAVLLAKLEAKEFDHPLVSTLRRLAAPSFRLPGHPTGPAAHGAPVLALATSADGRVVLSGAEDGTIALSSGEGDVEPLAQLSWTSLAIAADARWVAVSAKDRTLRLWDARERGAPRLVLSHPPMTALAFSPDGQLLACGDAEGNAYVLEIPSGSCRVRLVWATGTNSPGGVTALRFGSEGELLVGGESGMLKRWRWEEKRVVWQWSQGGERFVRWTDLSADDVVGLHEAGAFLQVQDLAKQRPLLSLPAAGGRSYCVGGTPGQLLGLDADGQLLRFAATGQSLFTPTLPWRATALAASEAYRGMVIGSATGRVGRLDWPPPKVEPVFELSSLAPRAPTPARPSALPTSPHVPRGGLRAAWRTQRIATTGRDLIQLALSERGEWMLGLLLNPFRLEVWEARTGLRPERAPYSLEHLGSGALSRRGAVLLGVTHQGEVEVRTQDCWTEERRIRWPGPVGQLMSVTDDGRTALEYLKTYRVRDVESGAVLWQVPTDLSDLYQETATLSEDGRQIVVGLVQFDDQSEDCFETVEESLFAWEPRSGRLLWRRETSCNQLSLSRSGKLLGLGRSKDLLLDAATGHTLGALPLGTERVAFSDDDRLAFCRLVDGRITVLDVRSSREHPLLAQARDLTLAAAGDGSTLAFRSSDEALEVWHLDYES